MVLVSWTHSTSVPLDSSQASSLGSRAVIEFTFHVAIRMPTNLPAASDNAAPRRGGGRRVRSRRAPGSYGDGRGPPPPVTPCPARRAVPQTVSRVPGLTRWWSVPPSAPIWPS
ncbi:hypothetical protein GA0115252_13583 [Streptomyces sp. DfronAA-171]|nr:hypothetical protein GA0115252_13583 [Streptomyces sp. DfronAA-171]